jgi:hypothetical protein
VTADRQQARLLLDRVPEEQLPAAVRFLEFLLLNPADRGMEAAPAEGEDTGDVAGRWKERSRDSRFTAFEQVVAELGFTMDQVRGHRPGKEKGPAE